ncbi:ComF family protein [Rhodovulum iodosum]|uniref:ComF family protein n=1 Tax=Rhodovulum iodosum TaxID=68291 RepID=A0ABV3XSE3_9RHOB|nr:ComF family protein [Rhodovulum robiginosum]RSK30350.1 ComF family protein [Rhodovulum robiginosum]
MQSVLRLIYPPRCLACGDRVESDFGLCMACWAATPFISGLVCDACGTPLPGTADPGAPVYCDDCLARPRPWARGRAALIYRDTARKMVLALKHGDRTDLAAPAAGWMLQAGAPLLRPGLLIAPVPLHRYRLIRRRYNQAALLARALARRGALDHCPDLLIRRRPTPVQEGLGAEARFANIDGAIALHPRRRALAPGREVLIVDDVMTSGATLSACAEACLAAGATEVSVLVLARVVRGD